LTQVVPEYEQGINNVVSSPFVTDDLRGCLILSGDVEKAISAASRASAIDLDSSCVRVRRRVEVSWWGRINIVWMRRYEVGAWRMWCRSWQTRCGVVYSCRFEAAGSTKTFDYLRLSFEEGWVHRELGKL
jgi:hypothetical protein